MALDLAPQLLHFGAIVVRSRGHGAPECIFVPIRSQSFLPARFAARFSFHRIDRSCYEPGCQRQ
jgi:hypothetical protein